LTVVADDVGIVESVCGAGHRYATCACQQPDCTGWKAISIGAHYPASFRNKASCGRCQVVR
jgi:hypothetical protein